MHVCNPLSILYLLSLGLMFDVLRSHLSNEELSNSSEQLMYREYLPNLLIYIWSGSRVRDFSSQTGKV
jgi:hypothetical protein